MSDAAQHEHAGPVGVAADQARLDRFRNERERLNALVLGADYLGIKRFFALDSAAYREGALDGRTKELLGLTASMVLRCNDCIDYHVIECVKAGWSDAELHDAMNVALVVGGSIVIPHLRHAFATLEVLRREGQPSVANP